MLFGRRRASFSMLFAPAPDDAPPGGGGGPPAPPAPPAGDPPPAPPKQPRAPPAPAVPAPDHEILRNPAVLAEIDRRMAETDRRARTEVEQKIREEMAEAARLEKLSVEERAKQEATAAKASATKAENAAKEARAENAFLRELTVAGVHPHDTDCLEMAWMHAKKFAGEGPITPAVIEKLRTEKTHLFKTAASAPAPAAPGQPAPANPAEVQAARTLGTQPPPNPGAAPAQPGAAKDARGMDQKTWDTELEAMGLQPFRLAR